jgi:hypothetical protein
MLNSLKCVPMCRMDIAFSSPAAPFSSRFSKLAFANPVKPQSFHAACRLFPTDSDISSRGQWSCHCAQGILMPPV